jgi:RimJ/RimL family protein N-acetyltransferase
MIYIDPISETDIKKLCALYCEEENIEPTAEYIEKSKETYRLLTAKGDMILGIFKESEKGGITDLIGCVSIHYMVDLYPDYEHAPYVHFETIIIKKAYRGKGYGTMLLQKAVGLCEAIGITYIIAQTATENIAMQRVYEKVGLSDCYVNYYKKC